MPRFRTVVVAAMKCRGYARVRSWQCTGDGHPVRALVMPGCFILAIRISTGSSDPGSECGSP